MASQPKPKFAATPHELPALFDAVEKIALAFESLTEARIFLHVAVAAAEGEDLAISRIAEKVGLPMSTASRIVWEMRERGWLEIHDHEKDRRIKLLRTGRAWRKASASE